MRNLVTSLLLVGGSGCVIPPPISLDNVDGGIPHQATLEVSAANPSFATTRTVCTKGPLETKLPQTTFQVGFRDSAGGLTVEFRFFLDGDWSSTIKSVTRTSPDYNDLRTVLVTFDGLCDNYVKVLGPHQLFIYITDGTFTNTGKDLRVVTDGGTRDDNFWAIECIAGPCGSS